MKTTLWICGKNEPGKEWEFAGVFSNQEIAELACVTRNHFVAPATLDQELPYETLVWPGAYYPLADKESES